MDNLGPNIVPGSAIPPLGVRTPLAGRTRAKRDRLFFSGMAVAIILTVFAGFAPTYYLKGLFGTPALTPLRHVHGAVFSGWVVLFLVQTLLVAGRRVDIHRRLGFAGAGLAVLMVVLGIMTALDSAAAGRAPPGAPPALVFLVIPLADMVVFPTLVGAAVFLRRRPDAHKRLMLLASISMLAAATGRLPHVAQAGPIAFFGLQDLFIVACAAYDLASRRRIHPATLWGGVLIIASQPLRLMIGATDVWMRFATWATGLWA